MPDYIAYYRVSTDKQGKSGLGLEAQRHAVMQYLNGGNWRIIEEYTEIESGKRKDRPKLLEALAAAKKLKATLIIAKLDRLARNVHVISGLLESRVDFIAVDNPNANKLMIHMLAAFAEHERDMISQRTKEGLAAAKARGKKLGSPSPAAGAAINKASALAFSASIAEIVQPLQKSGATLQAIADKLTVLGIATPRGGKWYPSNVRNVISKLPQTPLQS